MRAVVQRVLSAQVEVEGTCIARMDRGLLVLVGVGRNDEGSEVPRLARKLVGLRIFGDEAGRFDRSLLDVGGTIGLVSQFTLYGDARKGRRPSFGGGVAPFDVALPALREAAVRRLVERHHSSVEGGHGRCPARRR